MKRRLAIIHSRSVEYLPDGHFQFTVFLIGELPEDNQNLECN